MKSFIFPFLLVGIYADQSVDYFVQQGDCFGPKYSRQKVSTNCYDDAIIRVCASERWCTSPDVPTDLKDDCAQCTIDKWINGNRLLSCKECNYCENLNNQEGSDFRKKLQEHWAQLQNLCPQTLPPTPTPAEHSSSQVIRYPCSTDVSKQAVCGTSCQDITCINANICQSRGGCLDTGSNPDFVWYATPSTSYSMSCCGNIPLSPDNSGSNSESDSNSGSNSNSESDSNSGSDSGSNSESDSNSGSNSNSESNSESDSNSGSDSNSNCDTSVSSECGSVLTSDSGCACLTACMVTCNNPTIHAQLNCPARKSCGVLTADCPGQLPIDSRLSLSCCTC